MARKQNAYNVNDVDYLSSVSEPTVARMSCSSGWLVTGYYTPGEEEFHGSPVDINVESHGSVAFPGDFLRHVKIEGWGRTREGWFLGWDRRWLKSESALNARGRPLGVGSLAVDRRVIPMGTLVRIPGLPAPWGDQVFRADDTGGRILNKHVDVYCGDGPSAREQTYRITRDDHVVCLG